MAKRNRDVLEVDDGFLSEKSPKAGLIDRQSVRTTFNLSAGGREDLAWLVKHHKISVKGVIDYLVTLMESQHSDTIVKLAKQYSKEREGTLTRKTHVISRGSVRKLNAMARKHNVKRDSLLDEGISVVRLLIESVIEKEKERNRKAVTIIERLADEAEATRSALEKFLDADDIILERFGVIEIVIDNLTMAIEKNIHNDTPIDPLG